MPNNAPAVKISATAGYGAAIVHCEPHARQSTVDALVEEKGFTFIHPSNDINVIHGQGTTAIEFLEDCPVELDAFYLPVGGGGLIAGCSLATKGMRPQIRVVAVEPKNADDAFRSVR
jgi:threonine dehydratase